MAVPKHPIAYHWIKQTLVPFILYAFASTLPFPTNTSEQIQHSIDFCLQKPDHPSDGDDLVFERIFMAIMHRHRNLAPELDAVVKNLETLAKYLIRRAQLKGPYELLEQTDIASGAWMEHEWQRLANVVVELEQAREARRSSALSLPALAKKPPAECDIEPRLVHAQQGQFAAAGLHGQLKAVEDTYYRRHNQELEQYRLRREQCLQHHEQLTQQQHIHSPIYTQQNASQKNTSWRQALTTPQAIFRAQQLQHQTAIYGCPSANGAQTPQLHTIHQHPLPQAQPARHLSAQYHPVQQYSTYLVEAHHQLAQPMHTTQPYIDTALPTHLSSTSSPPMPSLHFKFGHTPHPGFRHAPTQPSSIVPSEDVAHLRDINRPNAAQQRAREIAAKITARERDATAKDIIQRHRAMVQQCPGLPSSTSVYGPTEVESDMSAYQYSAVGHTGNPLPLLHGGLSTPSIGGADFGFSGDGHDDMCMRDV